jgi:hypothetical protein
MTNAREKPRPMATAKARDIEDVTSCINKLKIARQPAPAKQFINSAAEKNSFGPCVSRPSRFTNLDHKRTFTGYRMWWFSWKNKTLRR